MNSLIVLTLISAAALVGAVCYTFGRMNAAVETPEVQAEKAQLHQDIMQLQIAPVVPPPTPEEDKTAQEMEALKDKIAALEAEQKFQEQLAAEQAAKIEEEAAPVVPAIDPSTEKRLKRRARQVSGAMLMAQVDSYTPEDGFVVINIHNYNNVVEGVKLAIRRNTGVVGQVEVTRVVDGQAIADVLSHTFLAGEVDIVSGDELILNPM